MRAEENRTMQNSTGTSRKITYFFLIFFSIAISAVADYMSGKTDIAMIRNGILLLLAQIIVIFCFNAGVANQNLFGNNYEHPVRFFITYIFMIGMSVGMTFLPIQAWPCVVFFAMLTLLSNIPTGIVSGLVCLAFAGNLLGMDNLQFLVFYLICGILTSVLLGNLDHQFKIAFPLVMIITMNLCGLTIISISETARFTSELLLYPVINAIVSLILLLLVLRIYSSKILTTPGDDYIDINDPECKLLIELKSIAPDDYFRSVHVAYFCDRIARKLGLDENMLKCAGYYHRVGRIVGERTWGNTYAICSESGFPPSVIEILKEYLNDMSPIEKTETAVLYMSECVVSSVLYLFSKNKDMKLDLDTLIETIFKQRFDTGMFNKCNISVKQIEEMKTVFKEEKLYYDFLR